MIQDNYAKNFKHDIFSPARRESGFPDYL